MRAPAHLLNLVAFLAVLGAIVLLSLQGGDTDLSIMTGLIGVLGSFRPWNSAAPPGELQAKITNSEAEPVPVRPNEGTS